MTVTLLRCSGQWVKMKAHPCWRVERALIDMGIDYRTVAGPAMPWQRDKRTELIEKTGATLYPAIEFEDGSVYREESAEMERTIREGRLFERSSDGESPGTPTP
jgi:uncharacterized protein YbjT (DUF2867 family)